MILGPWAFSLFAWRIFCWVFLYITIICIHVLFWLILVCDSFLLDPIALCFSSKKKLKVPTFLFSKIWRVQVEISEMQLPSQLRQSCTSCIRASYECIRRSEMLCQFITLSQLASTNFESLEPPSRSHRSCSRREASLGGILKKAEHLNDPSTSRTAANHTETQLRSFHRGSFHETAARRWISCGARPSLFHGFSSIGADDPGNRGYVLSGR